MVTVFDKPWLESAGFADPFSQFGGGGNFGPRAPDLSATQQVQRPCHVLRRCIAQILDERIPFVVRRGTAVQTLEEIGEFFHSSTSPNEVVNVPTFTPFAERCFTNASVLPCVAMTRFAFVSAIVVSRSFQSA